MLSNSNSYSADVRIHLEVGTHRLEVASCHSHGCLLRQSIDHPPSEAELVIEIDGHEQRRRVVLAGALSKTSRQAEFSIPHVAQAGA